jgi:hypothetical protein
MAEFVKETLEQVPLFVANFAKVVFQPVVFARETLGDATAKAMSTTKLNESLIFFGVCLVVTCVLKAAAFGLGPSGPAGHEEMSVLYLAKDAVWKIFPAMAIAGVMRLSWHLVNGRAPYIKYLILNCYFFGAIYVATHLVLLVATFAFGRPSHWSLVTTRVCHRRGCSFHGMGSHRVESIPGTEQRNFEDECVRSSLALFIQHPCGAVLLCLAFCAHWPCLSRFHIGK